MCYSDILAFQCYNADVLSELFTHTHRYLKLNRPFTIIIGVTTLLNSSNSKKAAQCVLMKALEAIILLQPICCAHDRATYTLLSNQYVLHRDPQAYYISIIGANTYWSISYQSTLLIAANAATKDFDMVICIALPQVYIEAFNILFCPATPQRINF